MPSRLADPFDVGHSANAALRRRQFLWAPIDDLSLTEVVEHARHAIVERRRLQHVSLNVAKFIGMRSDPLLRRDVEESDVIGADGMEIVWGCRLLGIPIRQRVAGADLMWALLQLCNAEGFRPYILGAHTDILDRAVERIRRALPDLRFAGYRDGYFGDQEEPQVIAAIRDARPDVLFIAIPTPRKESLLHRYRDALGVPVTMGVGGTVDVIAGHVKRAPIWLQRVGLEWAFRLAQEPRRMWRRYVFTNAEFALRLSSALLRKATGRPSAFHAEAGRLE